MEREFKDFHDTLEENLKSYTGQYDSFIDHSPELFLLLTEMLNLNEITSYERLKISAAIAYFVVPYDVIPEQIYGPYGYVDDIFISTFIIKEVGEMYGYDLLEKLWHEKSDLKEVINFCYNKSKHIVNNEDEKILKYVGIK